MAISKTNRQGERWDNLQVRPNGISVAQAKSSRTGDFVCMVILKLDEGEVGIVLTPDEAEGLARLIDATLPYVRNGVTTEVQ